MLNSPALERPSPLPRLLVAQLLLALPIGAALVAAACLTNPGTWGVGLLAVVLAVGVVLLIWHRPSVAAALVPALLTPPEFFKTFAYEIGLLVTFGAVLAAGLAGRRRWLWMVDPVELAVAAFVAWGFVTVFWSSSFTWWLFALRKYGIGLLALWTASRLARDPRHTWHLMLGIVAGSIVLASATLTKAFSSGFITTGSAFKRIEGTNLGWGNTNYIAAILALMLPTALHVGLHAPDRRARILGRIALPLSALVSVAAASRGGALLMVAVSMLYTFRQRLARQTALSAIGLAAVLGLMLVGPGSSQFLSRFTSSREQGSVLVRMFLLRAGWRRFLAHLPFGMGFGQGIVEPDHLRAGGPHNFAVTVGYELGIPGVLLWFLILFLIARRGHRYMRDPGQRVVAVTLLFTLGTAVLNSTFEGTFEGLHFQFLFFWIVGIYLGTLTGWAVPHPETSSPPAR